MREPVILLPGQKRLLFVRDLQKEIGVECIWRCTHMGPPSDPGQECPGGGAVGAGVRMKVHEGTEFKGTNDITAQCSMC